MVRRNRSGNSHACSSIHCCPISSPRDAGVFLDAATCTACGLLMTLGAEPLGQLMNLPSQLLLYAGLSLFPIAAFLAWVRARALHSGPALTAVIGGAG